MSDAEFLEDLADKLERLPTLFSKEEVDRLRMLALDERNRSDQPLLINAELHPDSE